MKPDLRFFADNWHLALRHVVSLLLWINFICIVLFISNIAVLLLMALVGAAAFILPGRVRFTPMTALVIVFFIYMIGSDYILFPTESGFGVYRRMLYAFFAGIGVYYVHKSKEAFFTIPLALIVAAAFCIGMFFFQERIFVEGRLALFMGHPNNVSLVFSISAISCLAALLHSPPGPGSRAELVPDSLTPRLLQNRYVFLLLFLFCMWGIWLTSSRTSFYTTLIVCLLVAGGETCRRLGTGRGLLFFCGAGLLLGIVLSGFSPQLFRDASMQRMLGVISAPWEDITFRSRIPGWESALSAFCEQPLFGNGPETFQATHEKYIEANYDRLVSILGKDIVEQDTVRLPHAHNQYLMFLAETGIVGLALFLALIVYPVWEGIRQRSWYGVTIPLLLLFVLLGCLESPFSGIRAGTAGISIFFMVLGYFSCACGQDGKNTYGSKHTHNNMLIQSY